MSKLIVVEGLKGFLYINSNKWAIQNVKAQPPDDSTGIVIKIQQAYELIGDYKNALKTDDDNTRALLGLAKASFELETTRKKEEPKERVNKPVAKPRGQLEKSRSSKISA